MNIYIHIYIYIITICNTRGNKRSSQTWKQAHASQVVQDGVRPRLGFLQMLILLCTGLQPALGAVSYTTPVPITGLRLRCQIRTFDLQFRTWLMESLWRWRIQLSKSSIFLASGILTLPRRFSPLWEHLVLRDSACPWKLFGMSCQSSFPWPLRGLERSGPWYLNILPLQDEGQLTNSYQLVRDFFHQ